MENTEENCEMIWKNCPYLFTIQLGFLPYFPNLFTIQLGFLQYFSYCLCRFLGIYTIFGICISGYLYNSLLTEWRQAVRNSVFIFRKIECELDICRWLDSILFRRIWTSMLMCHFQQTTTVLVNTFRGLKKRYNNLWVINFIVYSLLNIAGSSRKCLLVN
jgi:hypothetical protein